MSTAIEAGNAQPGAASTGAGQPATPAVADTSGQQNDQKALIDKAYAAAVAKTRDAEVNPLKAKLAELEAKLTGHKPIEEQAKEYQAKADAESKRAAELATRLEGWEKRESDNAAARAAKLPDALKPAWDKVSNLPLEQRLDVLASLEAAVPATGASSPPGGNMGTRTAGLDIAAISQGMAAGNPTLYREAIKAGARQTDIDRAMAEYQSKRR